MKFKSENPVYEKPNPGTYVGVCFKVVDMGTQEGQFEGKKTRAHKMWVFWELSEFDKDGKPFLVQKYYTKSMSETSNLRKDLESWRGKAFTEEEIETFGEAQILGKPAMLTLVESADKKYINVRSVTGLPKGFPAPSQTQKNVVFSLDPDEFNQEVFDSLSDRIKAKIMLSPEWAMLKGQPVNPISQGEEEPPHDSYAD